MDKKGQTLVLFVILIPIVLALIGVIVDMGIFVSAKSRTRSVIEYLIEEVMDNDISEDKVKEIMEKNNINIDKLEFLKVGDKITISNEITVQSMFGSIIGIKEYKLKIRMEGYKDNNKIIIT